MSPHDTSSLPREYTLHSGYPSVPQYLHLRSSAGLSPKTPSQAAAVSTGSWFGCFVTTNGNNEESQVVGMGRVIGDGGWYFHIADMAVHPEHQKKGLGDVILKKLLREIKQQAPSDGKPYISLLADEAGRKLYFKNGFVESAPGSLGMVLKS
ncbi:Acyl-CoA N-acyltransferase [Penicillium verhagenii]|uniref:Acyl-CoA N-acyltransferase n=1 Tax=Penicillium verhagenii TaxID=1562060 RepID=UPI002545BC4E|nr:Acyl-CoA N-acyltransferase [Penicillium verhagenii]KAJ5931144.1 Acyl-CoA N-acyltransferase [Penicillium verhagenii]